jgi:branched-chain amino acid transport system permease protein
MRRGTMVLDILISGLISGSIYALLAISFSLIYGIARIVNLAHTAFYMVASYCIYFAIYKLGMHPVWGMLLSVIIVTLFGLISYKLFMDPIREHEAAVLIGTIALAMAMQEIMLLIFTGDYLSVPSLINGYFKIFSVKVFYQQLLTFVVALIILAALWVLLIKTRLGLAIRSTAEDREVANLMGMDESRVTMITMGISVALAALTGAVIAPLTTLSPFMWTHPLIMVLAVVVLGGMGSIKGSFVGAYILGFAEAIVVFVAPMGAYLKGSVALSIMILVLLIRPEGLFGVVFEEER